MSFSEQFSGKVVAITGAASGIGLATAHLLAERGAKLSLADVQEEALKQVASNIKAKLPEAEVITFTVDVKNFDQVEIWTRDTVNHFGKLDGAANMAGVLPKSIGLKGIDEQDFDEWNHVIGVNLTGIMHCLKAQLAVIENTGAIVNASSIAGLIGRVNNASYVSSKHAVAGLTKSAAKESGPRGIRINAICPDSRSGKIITPMSDASKVMKIDNEPAMKRPGQPREVATAIAFLLSEESSYITGACIGIDGGWNC
ncbi:short chain dehydrogenase reductase family [Colletotrichum sojae]|uniref:Short chain dehydrogenase reductase family n=1 Tax=Colletotrichum sojae TaxID=2175907 RepID=A0A8H6MR33_9PEZI|nr:short chain dehydrogenase reductase family [Colletotrichum sojae]